MTRSKESTADSLARGLSAPRLSRIQQIDKFLISKGESGATFNEICKALGVRSSDSSRRRLIRQDLVSMEIMSENPDKDFKMDVLLPHTDKNSGTVKRYVSKVPLFPRFFTEGEKVRLSNITKPEIFNPLADAIASRTVIRLKYRRVSELDSDIIREIRFAPLKLQNFTGRWRLIGVCVADGFIASFYLEQILGIESTLDNYPQSLMKRIEGLYDDVVGCSVPRHLLVARPEDAITPEVEDVVLWVPSSTAHYLRNFPLNESQDELFPEAVAELASRYEISEEGCIFVLSAYITEPLIREILSLDFAIVLEPHSLRLRIKERLDRTLSYYK